MPSKNMIRKGKRRQTVKHEYRLHRDAVREAEAARVAAAQADFSIPAADTETAPVEDESSKQRSQPQIAERSKIDLTPAADGTLRVAVDTAARGQRLDAFLAKALPDTSRVRVQLLIEQGKVRLNGKAAKASLKLEGGEALEITGEAQLAPLTAEPEEIPLKIVHEDADMAVIDKPAGMLVHAGAGSREHNRGTLVNALLFHFQQDLSREGGALRPGIVHRLDKDTSGLLLVAKNDAMHRKLSALFQSRSLRKVYTAVVHGVVAQDEGTVDLPVGRDPVRRTRMTTRRSLEDGARAAVSHWRVLQRVGTREAPGPWGAFTLVEVTIETGRTHQIRVHLASLGHAVVGDTLYGAPGKLRRSDDPAGKFPEPTLGRNFLHAGLLELKHPRSGKQLRLEAPLPDELNAFAAKIGLRPEQNAARARRPSQIGKLEAQ